MPSEVQSGENVPVTLAVTNASDERVDLGLGGRDDGGYQASFDFLITDNAGDDVACKLCGGRVAEQSLSYRSFEPGETLHLAWDWDQRDSDGEVVAPGTYWVRGTFSALDESPGAVKPYHVRIEVQTDSQQLVISPPPP